MAFDAVDGFNHQLALSPDWIAVRRVAIIIRILCGKNGENEREVRFSGKELLNFLDYLQFEIALEEIRRWTDMSPEPATLETIFTDRSVNVSD